mmetsp:Transcript_36662/g.58793  ORF Transcript_36662/g.58793 Transcript_36662/m.58793 type:complete len:90 (-) Transcript_36662:714-983(-)
MFQCKRKCSKLIKVVVRLITLGNVEEDLLMEEEHLDILKSSSSDFISENVIDETGHSTVGTAGPAVYHSYFLTTRQDCKLICFTTTPFV